MQSSNDSEWKSIFDAARRDDEEAVKYFIHEERISPNITSPKEQTLAHIATLNGNLPLLDYILSLDLSLLTALDYDKNDILFIAIELGFFDVVRYLVEHHQMDITAKNMYRFGNNAIHIAAKAGHQDIIQYLFEERGADVNTRNDLMETPIFYAAEERHLDVVKYLVERWNANVTVLDWNDSNVLYSSSKTGDLSVPKYLMDERGVTYDINGRDQSGDTIVNRAVRYNQLEFIKYFVEKKQADVNIADTFNRTPLYFASSHNYYDIAHYLVMHGADIRIGDLLGVTPDKLCTADAVVKFLKKNMAEKIEEEKRKMREAKEKEREAVRAEKELEKQKIRGEKNLERQRVKEEKESEKRKAREERERLKAEKALLKNSTKPMPKKARARPAKKLKNATKSETGKACNSTIRLSDESMISSDEERTSNLSIVNSLESRESETRCRRGIVDLSSLQPVNQFTNESVNCRISLTDYDLTTSTYLEYPQMNSFLIVIDVCFRYIFRSRRLSKQKSSRASNPVRAEKCWHNLNEFSG